MAKPEQKLDKEFGTTNPQDNTEEKCQEEPSMEGTCISLTKALVAEEKQDFMVHPPKQELPGVLISLDPGEVIDVRDLVEEVAIMGMEEVQQNQEYACLKQEVRSSGGLDPGEDLAAAKVLVEVNSIKGKEEKRQRMLKEVSDCGGLDPGEAVTKDEVEECGFKEKVEECDFKDKVEKFVIKERVEVKPEMRMEEKKYVTKEGQGGGEEQAAGGEI